MKFLIICFFLLFASCPQEKKARIWLIGDSTMANKEAKALPETGWGMPFAGFFDSTIVVDNRARNGRSTRTFREEGLWKPVLENMQAGDYVLIQFGHNDEVSTKASYTAPDAFVAQLEKYVKEAQDHKGLPVLITPVARRKFDSSGHVEDTHRQYAELVRGVASRLHVPLIDLDSSSSALLQSMGPEGSVYLYNHLQPGEHPNYPAGKIDDTHFSELGARRMAYLVLADLLKLEPSLSGHLFKLPAK